MKEKRFLKLLIGVLSLTMVIGLLSCKRDAPDGGMDIGQALSSPDALPCFQRADRVIDITFPTDAGPHEDFQTEWWYYTGNLHDDTGRPFGFQLTFFRRALFCDKPAGTSAWRSRQLYMAHFAVTDVMGNAFYTDYRMSRESLGVSGASAHPFRVWTDNWQAVDTARGIRLEAAGKAARLALDLIPEKPPLLQGKSGLSPKSHTSGNASYYYSLPRNRVTGTLWLPEGRFQVSGLAWFDHEWSTSALDPDQEGWDWFAIHLSDGRDLMVCQVRNRKEYGKHFLFGSLSLNDGRVDILDETRFSISVMSQWRSPDTGLTYPSSWQIRVPDHGLELKVTPLLNGQEHTGDLVYWEGCVSAVGSSQGSGYVELTGY